MLPGQEDTPPASEGQRNAESATRLAVAFDPPGEVQLVKDINSALPTAKIYGGDGVCSGGETNPAKGGFPKSIAPLFKCTVATQGLTEDEAISLMSIAVDFGITQVVDGNWGVHAIIKKSLFAGVA